MYLLGLAQKWPVLVDFH